MTFFAVDNASGGWWELGGGAGWLGGDARRQRNSLTIVEGNLSTLWNVVDY